jgi:hypothetical protein
MAHSRRISRGARIDRAITKASRTPQRNKRERLQVRVALRAAAR